MFCFMSTLKQGKLADMYNMNLLSAFIISQVVSWAFFSVLLAPGVNDWREAKKKNRKKLASEVRPKVRQRDVVHRQGQRVVMSAQPIEASPTQTDSSPVPQPRG
jgi:hypothetical protein